MPYFRVNLHTEQGGQGILKDMVEAKTSIDALVDVQAMAPAELRPAGSSTSVEDCPERRIAWIRDGKR